MADYGRYTSLIPSDKKTATSTTDYGRYSNLIPTEEPVKPKTGFSIMPTVNKALGAFNRVIDRPTGKAAESTARQFIPTLIEHLPLGFGEAIKQIRDEPEIASKITTRDLIKSTPSVVAQTAIQMFIKSPASYPLTFFGLGAKIVGGNENISINLPVIGKVTNVQARVAEEAINSPQTFWGDKAKVSQYTGEELLNGLFFSSLASKLVNPRLSSLGTSKGLVLPNTIGKLPKPKSFRLFEGTPENIKPLPQEFVQKLIDDGVVLKRPINPNLPTYFKTYSKGDKYYAEIIQMKPPLIGFGKTAVSTPEIINTQVIDEKALTTAKPIVEKPITTPTIPPNVLPPALTPTPPTIPPTPPIDATNPYGDYKTLVPKEKKETTPKLSLAPSKAKTLEESKKERISVGFKKESVEVGNLKTIPKPFIGKTQLKTIFTNSSEFKTNPVLKVDSEKSLVFKGKMSSFKIKAKALGLNPDNLKEGDKITVDEKMLKEVGAEQQLRVYKGTTAVASIGKFRDGTPITLGRTENVKIIELPEMVDLARELMGQVPKIREKVGRMFGGQARGVFRGNGGGEITLRADLFDPELNTIDQAAKTLAHEIGHLIDYLPEGTLKRGNLLGRLNTLREFRKDFWAEAGQSRTNKAVTKELWELSQYWKPIDVTAVSPSFLAYRKSAKEIYADFISVLFNDPKLAQKMAPESYNIFFEQLDKKPAVRDAYFELQSLLSGDRQTLTTARREGVRGMFKEGDYKAWELQNAREAEKKAIQNDFLFRFKFELVDRNQALIDRVNTAIKKGKIIPEDENPLYYLEERNYVGGKQKALVEKYFAPVYSGLKKAGISWTDFGEVMFYRRIISGDRSNQANPRGITVEAAKELLADLEQGLTLEQKTVLDESLTTFREGMMKVNEEAYQEGMYKPELYEQMKTNPDYASFRVIDHLEDNVTSKMYKSIGTLKDIVNPADASIMKTLAVMRAVEYQKTKRRSLDFILENNSKDIQEAKTRWTGKHKEFVESKKDREELVMLYSKANKGKMEGYYVDPYIKASLENESVGRNNLIIEGMRLVNGKLFRPLYIGFNPGFQAFNFLRDFQRFWKNIPTMTLMRAGKLYIKALPAAKARAFGSTNQNSLEAIMEMEEKQILSVTFNDLVMGENTEDIQISTILKSSGIDSFSTPKKTPLWLQPIIKTLDFIKRTGDLIETLPKVAGYYEFTGSRSRPITKEQASFLRKNVGSPDFLAGGHIKPATNEIFLFSNAITQGLRSDLKVMTNPRTRSGYWWKTTKINFAPKLLMYLATLGIFGETVRKIMDGATEYDKTNYTIVPLGLDENGKSIYIRLPQDEMGRLLGGLTWKILNTPNNQQGIGKDVTDLVSYTGGQLPSVNPIVQDISATTQFLSGQNPYDFFRSRNVLSEDAHKAGGSIAFKQFAGWMFNQNGGSIFYRFYNEPSVPESKTSAEKIFNIPVFGPIASRFVRITNYGVREKLTEVKQEAMSDDAQRRLDERSFVNQYVEKYQKGENDERTLIDQMIKDKFDGKYPTTADDIETAKRIKARFQTSVKKGYASSNVRAVYDAISNNEKQAIIIYLQETLSTEEFKSFKDEVLKTKATTPEVFYEAEHKK